MRIILKTLICPLIVICAAIKWVGQFALSMMHWVFHLVAWLLAALAVVLVAFGEIATPQLIQLIVFSFLFFMMPRIIEGCARWAARVNEKRTVYVRT